jgi:Asp-tRNA(Asn)/Glu-tRNA(Gln) amidotransferase A subunit family amidase
MRLIPVLLFVAFLTALSQSPVYAVGTDTTQITSVQVDGAEKLIGLTFSNSETDSMLDALKEYREAYASLRAVGVKGNEVPAVIFDPIPPGKEFDHSKHPSVFTPATCTVLPSSAEAIAFMPLRDLAELIRTRQISSVDLTRIYIQRLKEFGTELHCVILLMEESALRDAARADREIAAGKYRGPLHGIPYGLKDLFAVKGYATTFGAATFKNNITNYDAAVVKKLTRAGSICVAKLSLGELAWGDVWFGGMTRSPWNVKDRSAGSSAGPAAATAAGLVPFAIGTETWGSIISPSTKCGITGLRPTFGRISRAGAMSLAWSIDKVGPICRDAEDCAIVLQAIAGADGVDQSVMDLPVNYDRNVDLSRLRIGYLKSDFDRYGLPTDAVALDKLRSLGAHLIEIKLPDYPVQAMSFTLLAEAAASFDELTRSGQDQQLLQQAKNNWPNVFRSSRFIPAVEYIQAMRLRHEVIRDMGKLMDSIDLYIAPTFGGNNLFLTNLTGHPCVVVPDGFDPAGNPTSITFVGRLFDEGTMLAVAWKYQSATGWHLKHPPTFYKGGSSATIVGSRPSTR